MVSAAGYSEKTCLPAIYASSAMNSGASSYQKESKKKRHP